MHKYKILNGSWLKVIAVITMLIDHVACYLSTSIPFLKTEILFNIGTTAFTPYAIMRMIGRISFPLFAFLITEGFIHTHDRNRYGLNLAVFAFISEIPWMLLRTVTAGIYEHNVFFTLLLGYAGLCITETFKENRKLSVVCLATLTLASVVINADYGIMGFAFIILLYALRKEPILQAIIGTGMFQNTWIAGLAFIPINMYNGERGFIKGKISKYLFYSIYPLHLLILYFINRSCIFIG